VVLLIPELTTLDLLRDAQYEPKPLPLQAVREKAVVLTVLSRELDPAGRSLTFTITQGGSDEDTVLDLEINGEPPPGRQSFAALAKEDHIALVAALPPVHESDAFLDFHRQLTSRVTEIPELPFVIYLGDDGAISALGWIPAGEQFEGLRAIRRVRPPGRHSDYRLLAYDVNAGGLFVDVRHGRFFEFTPEGEINLLLRPGFGANPAESAEALQELFDVTGRNGGIVSTTVAFGAESRLGSILFEFETGRPLRLTSTEYGSVTSRIPHAGMEEEASRFLSWAKGHHGTAKELASDLEGEFHHGSFNRELFQAVFSLSAWRNLKRTKRAVIINAASAFFAKPEELTDDEQAELRNAFWEQIPRSERALRRVLVIARQAVMGLANLAETPALQQRVHTQIERILAVPDDLPSRREQTLHEIAWALATLGSEQAIKTLRSILFLEELVRYVPRVDQVEAEPAGQGRLLRFRIVQDDRWVEWSSGELDTADQQFRRDQDAAAAHYAVLQELYDHPEVWRLLASNRSSRHPFQRTVANGLLNAATPAGMEEMTPEQLVLAAKPQVRLSLDEARQIIEAIRERSGLEIDEVDPRKVALAWRLHRQEPLEVAVDIAYLSGVDGGNRSMPHLSRWRSKLVALGLASAEDSIDAREKMVRLFRAYTGFIPAEELLDAIAQMGSMDAFEAILEEIRENWVGRGRGQYRTEETPLKKVLTEGRGGPYTVELAQAILSGHNSSYALGKISVATHFFSADKVNPFPQAPYDSKSPPPFLDIFVVDPLRIHATEKTREPVERLLDERMQVPSFQDAEVQLLEMQDIQPFAIVVIDQEQGPSELPADVAVIDLGTMETPSFALIIQEALAQWLNRPVGQIIHILQLEDGRLAIYV